MPSTYTTSEAELHRQNAELREENTRLEHEVDRLKQRERTPPHQEPRPWSPDNGGWMGG